MTQIADSNFLYIKYIYINYHVENWCLSSSFPICHSKCLSHIHFILLCTLSVSPQSLNSFIEYNRSSNTKTCTVLFFLTFLKQCQVWVDSILYDMWSRSWVASLDTSGKINCNTLPKLIWIITWFSFEFSPSAFAGSIFVDLILQGFSPFFPWSSYWNSMVVEIYLFGKSGIQRIATKQSIVLKLRQAQCLYFVQICIKNLLF